MNTSKKKILLLYTSHTLGHKSIAENIAYHLDKAGYEIKLADILEIQSGSLTEWGGKVHRFVIQHLPWFWSFLYTSQWFTNFTLPYRLSVASKNYQKTLELIQEFEPACIITTQTSASAVVAYLKQKGLYSGKFGIAFSDYHLHRYWLYWQADFYLANTVEQQEDMVELGIPQEKIFVCGVVLKDKPEVDTSKIKLQLGIGPHEKIVLVMSGSFGFGLDKDLIANIGKNKNVRVVVVTGRNKSVYDDLQKLFVDSNVTILGFYEPMDELYAISDVMITKPGGLSIAESLRWHVPLMVVYMLPGQEELNYSFLTEKGLIMPEPIAIADEVAEELSGGAFKKALHQNHTIDQIVGKPEVLLKAISSVI